MKKKFFLLAIALGLWGLNANAQSATTVVDSGNCGPTDNETAVTWKLTSDSILIISGTGAMKDYTSSSNSRPPWYDNRMKIKTAVVEEGITRLGNHAFYYCTNMTSINLPSTLKTIGTHAFYNCNKLTSLSLPEGLTSIATMAFYSTASLNSIHIPASLTNIAQGAFFYNSLTTITVAADNTAYTAEGNILYNKNKTMLHTWPAGAPYMEKLEIPQNITALAQYAFTRANIGYVIMHDGITDFDHALRESYVQGVTLPSNLTALPSNALYTAQIRSLTLPSGVGSVGNYAISTSYLTRLISLPTTPPTAALYSFSSTTKSIPVYVPSASVSAYQAANYWKSFTNIIGIVANGTCGDGLTWVLGADSTLVISGYGNMENYTPTSIPWIANRAGIKKVVVENFVTSIGDYAFHNMPNLSSVELGDRVLTIGEEAFNSCTNLSEITIPASVVAIGAKAFANTGLIRITAMPVTPPSAEENTFTDVPADIELVVPDESVDAYSKAIGWSDFGNHTTILASGTCGINAKWQLTNDGIMTVFGTGAMRNYSSSNTARAPWVQHVAQLRTLVVEEGITTIGNYAFYDCDSLTTVTLPSTVTTIRTSAFQNSANVNLTLHEGINSVGSYAFYNCPKLTTKLPSTLTTIYDNAFRSTGITSAHIPARVSTIGNYAFADCQNLPAITVDESNTSFCAQDGVLYNKDKTTICQYPAGKTGTKFDVPATVTTIGVGSFYNNTHLKAVSLPSTLTTIQSVAFGYCRSLEAINIPEGVNLGSSAFVSCSSLRSIVLPASLTSVPGSLLNGCNRIESIISLPTAVPTVATSAFVSVSRAASIYVPSASLSDYKAAETWKEFKSIIGIEASGTCGDGLTWVLGADSTLIISGYGAMNDYAPSGASAAPWNTHAAAIKSINIGFGVSKLGTYAFAGCTNVETMYVNATTPPTIADANSVNELPKGMLVYVPAGSINDYKAATHWKDMNIADILAQGKCGDNLTWTLTAAPDSTLTISGTGAMWNFSSNSNNPAPWYGYRNNIKNLVINEGATTIGNYAFRLCKTVTSASLPSTLITIGTYGFHSCDSLKNINIPEGIKAINTYTFYQCSSLENVDLPEGITTINAYAFGQCHNLKEVVLPSTLTNLGTAPWYNCKSLESFVLTNDTATGDFRVIDGILFSKDSTLLRHYPTGRRGAYTIPDHVKNMSIYAFGGASTSRVEIPDSTSFSGYLFYNNDSLRTVHLPRTMKALPTYAFHNADSLKSVTIPEGVTTFGTYALSYCRGLRILIMLPAAPPSITSSSFAGTPTDVPVYVAASSLADYQAAEYWKGLTNYVTYEAAGYCGFDLLWMVMPDSTLVISGYGDMDNYTEAEPAPWNGMAISRVEIGANVTGIGQMAFAGCADLMAFQVKEGSETFMVKDSVLYSKDGRTIVAYPAAKPATEFRTSTDVTTIAPYAFANATNLTELELTADVSRIGEGAFSGCTNIATIVSHPTTPPTIADDTFNGVDKTIPVYVPYASLSTYEEAEYWKDFFENFQPIPGSGLGVVEKLEGVYVVNGRIMVYGYTGQIRVFDVSGRCVLTTTENSFTLPQGAYLLRAGNAAAKVLVP